MTQPQHRVCEHDSFSMVALDHLFFLSSKCSITQIETVMQCLSSEQKDLFLPLMKNKSRKIRGTNGFIVFIQWMVQF